MSLSTLFAAATDGATAQLPAQPTGSGVYSTFSATPFSNVVESAINGFDAPGFNGSISPTSQPASSDNSRFVIELAVPGALDVWPSQLDAADVDPSRIATQGKPDVTVKPDQALGTSELPLAPNEPGSETGKTVESLANRSRDLASPHLTPEQPQGTGLDGQCGKSLKRRNACGNQPEPAAEAKASPMLREGVSEKVEGRQALESDSESKEADKVVRPKITSNMGRTLMGWLRAAAAARNAANNAATPVSNGIQVATAETILPTAPKCPDSALDSSHSQSLGRQNGISAEHPSPIALTRRVSHLRSREAAPDSTDLDPCKGTMAQASVEPALEQTVADQMLQEPPSSKADEISFAEVLQPSETAQLSAQLPIQELETVSSETAQANAIASLFPVVSRVEDSIPVAPEFSQTSSASATDLNEPVSIDEASPPAATGVSGVWQDEGRGLSALPVMPTNSRIEFETAVVSSQSGPHAEVPSSLASVILSGAEASTQAPFPAQAGLLAQISEGSGSVLVESFEPAPVLLSNPASQVSFASESGKDAPPLPPQFVANTPVANTDAVTSDPTGIPADLRQTVVAPLIETPVSPVTTAAPATDDTSAMPPIINPESQRIHSATASPSGILANLSQTVGAPLIETPVSPVKTAAPATDDTSTQPPTMNPDSQRIHSATASPSGILANLSQTVGAPLIETPVSPVKTAAPATDDTNNLDGNQPNQIASPGGGRRMTRFGGVAETKAPDQATFQNRGADRLSQPTELRGAVLLRSAPKLSQALSPTNHPDLRSTELPSGPVVEATAVPPTVGEIASKPQLPATPPVLGGRSGLVRDAISNKPDTKGSTGDLNIAMEVASGVPKSNQAATSSDVSSEITVDDPAKSASSRAVESKVPEIRVRRSGADGSAEVKSNGSLVDAGASPRAGNHPEVPSEAAATRLGLESQKVSKDSSAVMVPVDSGNLRQASATEVDGSLRGGEAKTNITAKNVLVDHADLSRTKATDAIQPDSGSIRNRRVPASDEPVVEQATGKISLAASAQVADAGRSAGRSQNDDSQTVMTNSRISTWKQDEDADHREPSRDEDGNRRGMAAAQQPDVMKRTSKRDGNASQGVQKMPSDGLTAAPAEGKAANPVRSDRAVAGNAHAVSGAEIVSLGRGLDWSIGHAMHLRSTSNLPEVREISAMDRLPSDRIERLEQLITKEVMIFRRTSAESVSVVLKPDSNTDLVLEVHQRNGQMEASMRIDRGDVAQLASQWPRLQEALAEKSVVLLPLSGANTSFSQSQQDGDRPTPQSALDQDSSRREHRKPASEPEGEPALLNQNIKISRTSGPGGRKLSARGFEFWA